MMIYVFISLLILLLVLYCCGFYLTKGIIETYINSYHTKQIYGYNAVNEHISAVLNRFWNTFSFYGALAFPLTALFAIGASFGTKFFNILIDDNYENRIITWFV
jgi:hypothetical protein